MAHLADKLKLLSDILSPGNPSFTKNPVGQGQPSTALNSDPLSSNSMTTTGMNSSTPSLMSSSVVVASLLIVSSSTRTFSTSMLATSTHSFLPTSSSFEPASFSEKSSLDTTSPISVASEEVASTSTLSSSIHSETDDRQPISKNFIAVTAVTTTGPTFDNPEAGLAPSTTPALTTRSTTHPTSQSLKSNKFTSATSIPTSTSLHSTTLSPTVISISASRSGNLSVLTTTTTKENTSTATVTATSTSKTQSPISGAIVGGIIAGLIATLMLFVVIGFCFYRCRKRKVGVKKWSRSLNSNLQEYPIGTSTRSITSTLTPTSEQDIPPHNDSLGLVATTARGPQLGSIRHARTLTESRDTATLLHGSIESTARSCSRESLITQNSIHYNAPKLPQSNPFIHTDIEAQLQAWNAWSSATEAALNKASLQEGMSIGVAI